MREPPPAWRLEDFLERFEAAGIENRWFGAVPNTEDGLGHVVTCAYWIEASRRVVRCDSFATLDLPL